MKNRFHRFTLAAALLLAATAPSALAETVRRAVVVGIDDYVAPDFLKLRGCQSDAQSIVGALKDLGFRDEDITLLTNEAATKAAVTAAVETRLVKELPAGGVGVLYFAGHGIRVPDLNNDEEDGMDEALVMHDSTPENPQSLFSDDEIGAMTARVPTQNLLVLLDSCHSGTANRTASRYADFRTVKINWPEVGANRSLDSEQAIKGRPGHVVITGCQPTEVANELTEANLNALGKEGVPTCGLFTHALVTQLKEKGADISLADLKTQITERTLELCRITAKIDTQHPWMENNSGDSVKLSDYLAGKAPAPSPEALAAAAATAPAATPAPEPVTYTTDGVAVSGSIPLTLAVNKRNFVEGDVMRIQATAAEDCYVRLYYLAVDGSVTQLFPNQFYKDNFMPKGHTVEIPGPIAGFDLKMGAPFGVEILKLVASNEQFTDLHDQNWATQVFQTYDIGSLQQMTFRGVKAEQSATRFGDATVFYRVRSKEEAQEIATTETAPATPTDPAAPISPVPGS